MVYWGYSKLIFQRIESGCEQDEYPYRRRQRVGDKVEILLALGSVKTPCELAPERALPKYGVPVAPLSATMSVMGSCGPHITEHGWNREQFSRPSG